MVDAINHDAASTMATAGGEALKGSLLGGAIATVGGAIIGAALVASIGAFLGGASLLVIGLGALVGGVVGTTSAAAPMAAMGGMIGMAKGGNRVSSEQQAYRDKILAGPQDQVPSTADNSVIQQGYQMGLMDGQQSGFQKGAQYGAQAVVAQIQQHMAAQPQTDSGTPDMAATPEAQTSGFAGKVASCKCESKVEAVNNQRAAAAASVQLG